MKKIALLLMFFQINCFSYSEVLTGQKISDIDDSSYPAYYGFKVAGSTNTAIDKEWYIMQRDTQTVRYVIGRGYPDYDVAWSTRAYITYYDLDEVNAYPR